MSQSLPSRRRRWFRWFSIAVGALAILAAVSPSYGLRKDRNTYQCQTCFSKRHEFQWKIGDWSGWSLPVSPKRLVVDESRILRKFTPLPHEHEWKFAQGSPYYWFGSSWGGCALGSGRSRNELVTMLEMPIGEIDRFIGEKLRSGELSTNQLFAALRSQGAASKTGEPLSDDQKLAEALMEEFWNWSSHAEQ